MRLVVFGATGGTGRCVVDQAISAGHRVLAVVRNPGAIVTRHPHLEVLKADVRDPATFRPALVGADAVINALGFTGRPTGAVTLYSASSEAILTAMAAASVRRLVMVTAGAYVRSANSPRFFRWVVQPLLLRLLKPLYEDMQRAETLIEASDAGWTIVRPSRLTDGPRTGRLQLSIDGLVPGGWSVSRADLAAFIVECATSDRYEHQRVALAS